jgi:dihydrolipoamide dehydrogenase
MIKSHHYSSTYMKHYDLIIIGTGGGTKLRPAADLEKKVAIIEKEDLGGTCLNRGCIPSKMLIYPADLRTHWQEDHEKFFMKADPNIRLDWPALIKRTTETIQAESESIKPGYEQHEYIDLYQGHARFVGPKIVDVNGEAMTADKIYIATGSRPSIPPIPGLEGTPFMTSREALRETKQPKKMVIIGGGYIAVELGHFYGAMGTEVEFVVRSRMIRAEALDIRDKFEQDFCSRYKVRLDTDTKKISYVDETFFVTIADSDGNETVLEADALLVATGVEPNTDDLGLENTNIQTCQRGWMKVNESLETNEPGVYALGDILNKYLFRHSVNFEGEYLYAQHYGGGAKAAITYPPMPHAIFSYPQIAGVGLTEDELLAEGKTPGKDYLVAWQEYKHSGMGMAMRPEVGGVKLLVDKSSRQLIGAHIIGEKASDIIHMLIAYMTMKATADQLLDMIYIHPALSEVIRNAARKIVLQLDSN